MARMSSITKDRIKKMLPAMIAFAVVMIVATVLYSLTSKTSNVDVWAVGTQAEIAENSVFGVESLRVVSLPSDKALLESSVPVSGNDFQGAYTAVRDLNAGALLSNSDFVPGELRPDDGVQFTAESPNRMVMSISATAPSVAAEEISIPAGNIQLVSDTIPPAHIACVQYLGEGTGTALIDPKDYTAILLWQATGRMQAIQQTADECPVGGQPRLCGILTHATDPADLLTPEQRQGGYAYVEEVDPELLDDTTLPLVELPRCRTDNGSGVFDEPGKLTSEFCGKINISYLEDVLDVPLSRLQECGNREAQRNPEGITAIPSSDDIAVFESALESAFGGEEADVGIPGETEENTDNAAGDTPGADGSVGG